jgi:hypothetical protein
MATVDVDYDVRASLLRWLADCGGGVNVLKHKLHQLVRDCRSCEVACGEDYRPAITRSEIAAQERDIAERVERFLAKYGIPEEEIVE